MNKALKKELALLAGMLALRSRKLRSPYLTSILSVAAAGFYFSSLENHFDYRGKTVFITGGSRGLGLSLAWNLLAKGSAVMLAARDEKELERAKEILLKDYPNGRVFTTVCDVTDAGQLAKSIDEGIDKMDGIDLLINNAGSILVGPFSSMEQEDFEAQMKLHLYAPIAATQLIFAHFKMRGAGRILNICSAGGKVAIPHMIAYDASKFALAGFSQGVNAELRQHNICVTTAYPTVMRTGSPIQAVFKGDHEKEFQWFSTIDNLPLLSMSADEAAKKILVAVADGRSEVVLSLPVKARIFFGAMFPETMQAVMGLVARLLPTTDSILRKTGADSNKRFEKSWLSAPVRKTAHKEEETYNQEPKHDAETNLGLH